MKCPKCGKEKGKLLAMSRRDNKTSICDECGTIEALEDYENATGNAFDNSGNTDIDGNSLSAFMHLHSCL